MKILKNCGVRFRKGTLKRMGIMPPEYPMSPEYPQGGVSP